MMLYCAELLASISGIEVSAIQNSDDSGTNFGHPDLVFSILYYIYCMMLWIFRSGGLGSASVNNL